MSEWREFTLGKLIDDGIADLQTGPFGTMLKASEYSDVGTPVIAVQDIGENRLIHNKFVYVEQNIVTRLSRYKVKEGDIIFGRKGAVERRARIRKDEDGWLQGSDCIRLRFNSRINSIFISYQFGSKSYREWMIQNSTGATMPSLNQSVLKLLPIRLPPIEEQKAIADILSSFDDKIDLLHRQNKTLESMAETLFRQWFVEDAQEDWEEKGLLELVDLVGGGTPKTSINEYWCGDIPWLSGGDIATHHKGFISRSEKNITQIGLENSSAKLLTKLATVISARGTVGKHCLLASEMTFSQSNYGILPKIKNCYYFTYLLIGHIVEELQSAAYGSVFDTITTATFRDATFKTPSEELIFAFEEVVKGYFEKKLFNQQQIHILEKIRDGLLPKLMNGEITVV
ncbi:restriction endonuclease subunit S [Cellvibrio japonicus]|uniref:Type I restriction system specificity protein n=1 Tax=Cellvibrio japonicus (strain Ueda107) TaxID=498211 RepID=B3PH43_CELJU|nr:restriction endonuclease subunit S [Cellvibrio japonicus]ACE85604.1 type I restriction system specificity protein [Cellvibrio japonicus Ueda107]QEI13843.1 restriction endonuclease subunit S [Cellvibrio japonicus]QEI17417.1 restriction endonuclease subunit S [Cellvibrio japonicus]QEI20993.1 restriction endonuclease subunit S [Cellvibrio japonicus]